MEVLGSIIRQLTNYIESLDWGFIITFILIAYIINHSKVTATIFGWLQIKCTTRYRVALIGVLYGAVLHYLRASSFEEADVLFQSFVFAMVFHKLIIDLLVKSIMDTKSKIM